MGWTGALLSGLRKGHLSLRRLAWQGPGPPACSGIGGARGCQASWQRGGHSPGMERRWGLGSGVGWCSSSLGLLLAVPSLIPAALGLSCHYTGSTLAADSKPGCC